MTGDWRSRWEGGLSLSFDRDGNRTRLREQHVTMPLAFQKVFYPVGPEICYGVILHPPGGFAKGDQLTMEIRLGAKSEVLLTTPGAGKFYESARRAAQKVRLCLEAGAHLEWVPQETILFQGAQMLSTLRVDLEAHATWMGWDIWRFGRSGADEEFSRGHWRAGTEVWRDGSPLWIDRQELLGGDALLRSRFGLQGYPVVGTFAWIGQTISNELLGLCRSVPGPVDGSGWAVGRVAEGQGLVARYLGRSTAEARRVFAVLWAILRERLRHRPLCLPRVWNT